MEFAFQSIGTLSTCFKEKFGIPRQPGLVAQAQGVLKLHNDPFLKQAIRTLDGFSHLWIIFIFHKHDAKNWKPSIRPPRLGGAKKVGVLASRSPHRPNPIGLSVVKIEKIDFDAEGGPEITVSGVDILDDTPVIDIKPYIPYADSVPDAKAGWAEEPIDRAPVSFTDQALRAIQEKAISKYPDIEALITEMLSIDPRPAFQKRRMPRTAPEAQGTTYGFRLFEFDVKWKIENQTFSVLDLADFIDS